MNAAFGRSSKAAGLGFSTRIGGRTKMKRRIQLGSRNSCRAADPRGGLGWRRCLRELLFLCLLWESCSGAWWCAGRVKFGAGYPAGLHRGTWMGASTVGVRLGSGIKLKHCLPICIQGCWVALQLSCLDWLRPCWLFPFPGTLQGVGKGWSQQGCWWWLADSQCQPFPPFLDTPWAVWWEQHVRGGVGAVLSDPGVGLSCVCPGQKLPMSGEQFWGFT